MNESQLNAQRIERHGSEQVYHIEVVEVSGHKSFFFFKRFFDIVLSLLLIAILLIPMCIIGLIVSIDSEGTPIFRQERVGKNGKKFMIYKFRTMHKDAEKDGAQWADKDDERCTRFGRILRKTRIDELPQLFNIFIGNMSFVGPRPEREYFYELFETYIHGFSNRLVVTPGLTGWAQVNGGYDLGPEEKIVYDMDYIRNCSVCMDLKCMLLTVKVLFTHDGAR